MLLRLKELRSRNGISQKQLADVVSISQQSVNKYENHDVQPDLQTLMRLAEYFQVSVDYLIGFSDYPKRLTAQNASYDEEDLQMLSLFSRLTPDEKASIRSVMQHYCSLKEK